MFEHPKYQTNFSEKTVADAMGVEAIKFENGKGNWPQETLGACAVCALAMHEFDHPGSTLDGESVAARVVMHLRSATQYAPQLHVGPWWANPTFACAVAIAKGTPTVWGLLSEKEIEKLDWIMRGYAVIINYAANAKNNFLTGPELLGNYNKSWNPNFRSSNLIQILACVSYFGTADAVNDILLHFSYDEYISKYNELGFTNVVENWTKGDKQNGVGFVKNLMENGAGTASAPFAYKDGNGNEQNGGYGVGVKVPFTYTCPEANGRDIPLSDTDAIFNCLVLHLYAKPVVSRYCEAYTANNAVSPYEGQMGMMKEYSSADAKGIRSDAGYCTHNFNIMVPGVAALTKLGLWNPESESNKALHSRIYVGNEDHIFKLTEGYYSYSHGKLATTPHTEKPEEVSVYSIAKAVWREFVTTFITYTK